MKFTNQPPPQPAEVQFDPVINSKTQPCECGCPRVEVGHIVREVKEVITDNSNILRNIADLGISHEGRYLVISVLVCKDCGKFRMIIPGSEKPCLHISILEKNHFSFLNS